MSSFCTAKAAHICSAKNFSIFAFKLDVNSNKSLTNDIVSFEQPGPDESGSLVLSQGTIKPGVLSMKDKREEAQEGGGGGGIIILGNLVLTYLSVP